MADTAPLAAVMMTLAGIAYGKPSAIPGYLAARKETLGEWCVAWTPTQPDGLWAPDNFAYLARNTQTGAHVLAIRGTYPHPLSMAYWDDAHEDSPFGEMQPWPGAESSGAKVSAGTWTAFQRLTGLAEGDTTLAAAIAAIPPEAPLFVTGHSLGGTLAPVLALWITETQPHLIPTVHAFAGMTPGNAAFAALFGPGRPLAGRVTRHSNTLDQVAYGWDRVQDTADFFAPGLRGGYLVKSQIEAMAKRLLPYGFTAIGGEVRLVGQIAPPPTSCEVVGYVWESLHQHMPDTYLGLLGAPPLPFSLGFGATVHDRDGSAPPATALRRTAAYL